MHNRKKSTWLRRLLVVLLIIILLSTAGAVAFHFLTQVHPPACDTGRLSAYKVIQPEPDHYKAGNNWLRKSQSGLWEMYTEGTPFDRGVVNGLMARHLIGFQEAAFISRIREMIPSDNYLRFLKYFIYWFNRNLDKYIPEEYREEIYGISLSASREYDVIGPAYQRMLNYHSAHDIGHALQDLSMVGCTSFGVWGEKTAAGDLLIGRNFDFYAGDEFARNKIVSFVRPDRGIPFMTVTWGGMIGAVSGMNAVGLTVTINAAKSQMPLSARTPISLLAREILQYASTISEAYEIAGKRQIFVSESILVGSARDGRAVIIEKSPYKQGLIISDSEYIVCANHFQSATFANDPLNLADIRENASLYRQKRLVQLLTGADPVDEHGVAKILRDQSGLNGKNIGSGNEKAINQLIAHHSIIFMPAHGLVWVSTAPWQLGSYVCYDISKIFSNFAAKGLDAAVVDSAREIPPDQFLNSPGYCNFLRFREMRSMIRDADKNGVEIPGIGDLLTAFATSNPEYYEVYSLAGDYYYRRALWMEARKQYYKALEKTIPRWSEKMAVIEKLADCNIRLKTGP